MPYRPALNWRREAPGRNVRGTASVRLRLVAAAFGALLAVVAGRVVHLQGIAADRFVFNWDDTSTVLEPIPASNGRIVSSDGVVLAFDRTRFDLSVHYRWLEDPPNPRWLAQQARQRLPAAERRDRAHLKRAESEVLASREQLWSSLASLTGVDVADLGKRRQDIQQRISRMVQ